MRGTCTVHSHRRQLKGEALRLDLVNSPANGLVSSRSTRASPPATRRRTASTCTKTSSSGHGCVLESSRLCACRWRLHGRNDRRIAGRQPAVDTNIRADLIPSVGKDMGRLEPHCRSKHEPTLSHRAFKDGKGCHRAPSHSVSDTATCGYTLHGRPAPAQIVIVQWARTIDQMQRTADSLGSGSGAAERPQNDVARSTTSRCAQPFCWLQMQRCSTLLLLRRTPSRRRSGLLLFGLPFAFG